MVMLWLNIITADQVEVSELICTSLLFGSSLGRVKFYAMNECILFPIAPLFSHVHTKEWTTLLPNTMHTSILVLEICSLFLYV